MQNIDEVIISTQTGNNATIGIITLNRPSALNALNLEMIHVISNALLTWQKDPSIAAVVIRGAGEKAFCAGGDIKTLYLNGKQNPEQCLQFFYHEYRLNNLIKEYTKPYIALMHGITMGGGIGVSIHGSHRVAAQNLMFAMPESSIGFFTDVGASYFLSRCPDSTGYYLGLTGNRINCKDAHFIGLVDHVIAKQNHQEAFDEIMQALCNTKFSLSYSDNLKQVTESLKEFSVDSPLASNSTSNPASHASSTSAPLCNLSNDQITTPSNVPDVISNNIKDIKACFNAQQVSQILHNLTELNTSWANQTLVTMNRKSPTSLMVIFELLQRAKKLNFSECMQMEYSVANGFLRSHDFYEGVRAAIIDKDNNPSWEHVDIKDNEFAYQVYFNASVALNFDS